MKKEKISPELLQKVKDSVNILEVIGEHVVLRKSGANYVGLCPFHSERSPSFSVSENKQLYHCYGCKKGGDLVTFVMEVLGISFPEAVEDLADRARIKLPQGWNGSGEDPEQEKQRSAFREKQSLAFKLNRFAAAFFHQTLGNDSKAIEYLMTRGIAEDWAKAFYLGAVSDSWDSLARHLVSRKAPMEMALELGLIRPSTKGQKMGPGYFDLFWHRVIFPILNLRGKVAGFGGRILGEETPKYLNSPESLIFQKGKLAYGLYHAQKHIREKDELVLVEGYFDVLAMHAAGFQNVVATCGTAITPDHLAIFKRFASKLTVLFDGDKAGVAATERAMEVALDAGWVIYGAKMPEGLDPDEVVLGNSKEGGEGGPESDQKSNQKSKKSGQEQMAEILKNATAMLDSRIDELIRTSGQESESRTVALKKIGGWLSRLQDPIGREVRIDQIQKRMGVSRQLLQQIMGGSFPPVSGSAPRSSSELSTTQMKGKQSSSPSKAKLPPSDRALLAGLASGGEFSRIFAEARDNLPPKMTLSDLFEYPPLVNLLDYYLRNRV